MTKNIEHGGWMKKIAEDIERSAKEWPTWVRDQIETKSPAVAPPATAPSSSATTKTTTR